MKFFFATKALIVKDNKVLILREAATYKEISQVDKWGVPGGRLEPGEHFADALIREVMEECGLTIELGKPVHVDEWRPTIKGEQWQIVATFFECKADNAKITLSEEHDDYAWASKKDLENYNLMKEDFAAILRLWR